MTSVENDDPPSNLIDHEIPISADAQLTQILGAVTMAATTEPSVESVISESANVVVERMSSGSPTWTLTATADRGIAADVSYVHESKEDDSSLFDIQGSGLLTQAQLRQIGEALRAEVTPDTADMQVGMMEPPTAGMESVLIGTDGHEMEGVVSGDNPMFSGSDQQEYDELSIHAEDEAVEELEGDPRNPLFGLSDSAESKQLTVGLDDSGLGSRHLFEDVMNAGLLGGVVKDEVLVPASDIAATATVTTSEAGEITRVSKRERKPKAITPPKREGTRRSARLAKSGSTDDTSSDTTDKTIDENLKKDSKHDMKTIQEDATNEGPSLKKSSKQQRTPEIHNSKHKRTTNKDVSNHIVEEKSVARTEKTHASKKQQKTLENSVKRDKSNNDTKKIGNSSGNKKIERKDSASLIKSLKFEKKDTVDRKVKSEHIEDKVQSSKKELLEEGELEDGEDLEEGEVRDSPKKVKVTIELTKLKIEDTKCVRTDGAIIKTDKSASKLGRVPSIEGSQDQHRGSREGISSRNEKDGSRRHRRDSKERRHRRSSSERRERREARMRRREQRHGQDSDSDSDEKSLAEKAIKELKSKKVDGGSSKELPRRYSMDDMKKFSSPPMARRSKPFSAADPVDDAKKLGSPPMARRSKPFSASDMQRKKILQAHQQPLQQQQPVQLQKQLSHHPQQHRASLAQQQNRPSAAPQQHRPNQANPGAPKHRISPAPSQHRTSPAPSQHRPSHWKKPAGPRKKSAPTAYVNSNEESDISLSSSDHGDHDVNDSDWTTDDDPEKLWCICRRPADNRFMIRCDDCTEWYHGSCVNISKPEGQRLEKENIQWICPHCVKKDKRETKPTMGKSEKERHHSHHSSKRDDRHESSRSHDHRSHDHKDKKKAKEKKKSRLKYSKPEPPKQHCLGIKCENWAKPSAIYCSTRCIVSHCRDALKLLEEEKEKATGSKHRRDSFGDALATESSKPADREPERVSVIERHTGRLRTGLSAPTRLQLPIWLERHPTYEVLKPNMKHGYTTSQFYSGKSKHSSSKDKDSSKPLGEIREGSKSSSSTPSKSRRDSDPKLEGSSRRDSTSKRERRDSHHEAGTSKRAEEGKKNKTPTKTAPTKAAEEVQDSVRMSVKRGLWDVLWTRVKGSDDYAIPEHKVKRVAYNVENELFKLFNEANNKYKAKYRSLIFNIKDPKNQGLFRRILKRRIPADELVCMSSDQLASKELAEWREREAKHVLDMIVTEEENRKEVRLTKKTHKGEVEISDDFGMLETNEGAALKVSTAGHDSLTSPAPLTSPTNPLNMLDQDTTEQHNNHLFDMNCKICTGKVAPPKEEVTSVKEVVQQKPAKRSRSFSSSDRQSSVDDEVVTKKPLLYGDDEEDIGDKEEGELDEEVEEEADSVEKPSYSYSEEADDTGEYSPEYEPPDVSSSPDGHNMQSYLPASTTSSYQPVDAEPDDNEPEEPVQYSPPANDINRPISPVMSSPEEEKPKPSLRRIIPPVVWKGGINMPEVARFSANGYHVSGPPHTIATDIPANIEICGRIPHKMVWDYFSKLKNSRTTELIITRFHIQQDTDKPAYAALFQYFHSRKRIGVVGNNRPHVKDMYILPLAAQDEIPIQIQPFNGPGMERHRPHTFLGLIVRHKENRSRSASMGHMPVSQNSALPGRPSHPAPLKRHMSQPGPSAGGTPPLPDWTEPGYDPKRAKQTVAADPIVEQYANADAAELEEEPYSPTREEREAPYDPMDIMDDIGEVKKRGAAAGQTVIKNTGGTPPLPVPEGTDPSKLNDLLENMSDLNANDIAHAASDVTENLLTAFSSKPNLTEQQQLLIKLTKQVEDAKKALLDRQIASLQSEIDKAATEITVAGTTLDDPTEATTPAVTATMLQQLPGTKLPSPRILRAPADSSTNNPDQRLANLVSGSPGTPTEEDAQGKSGLGMIQNAYVDPNLDGKQTTYTYGNVFTEGGATYPTQLPPMQGGPPQMPGDPPGGGAAWQDPSANGDQRHPVDKNNPPPNWNNPPFGGPDGPPPPQMWDKPPFQSIPENMPPNPALNPPQPFNPEGPFQHGRSDHDQRKRREFNRHGSGGERLPPDGRPGDRFPPDGRPDRPRNRDRGPPTQQQLEEGELSDHEDSHHRSDHDHRSGHEPWRSKDSGPRRGGHRGSHHDYRGGGGHGPRRDDQRGYRDHDRDGGRRWNGPDRARGKWRGQAPRGRDQGQRGRDHGGNRFDYHRY